MSKKKEKSPVYVRLKQNESFQSKKGLLSSQAELIKISQSIKKYKLLRQKELTLKQKLFTNLKDISLKIKELETLFPEPEITIKTGHYRKKEPSFSEEENVEDDLELQLRDIQKKLNFLANSN